MPDLMLTPLDDLCVIDARGADALTFLNGQLSQDITLLPRRGSLLAGLHTPQGRVVALLRVLYLGDDHALLALPVDLAATVRPLLARYVLRSKVRIEDTSTAWRVYGLTGPDAAAAASTRIHMPVDPAGIRQLIVAPRSEALPDADGGHREDWRLDDIRDGIPEVLTATSGLFVSQMLNLDLLQAISFSKGCYTGQEIIARAHYRGQVKRRMQRFRMDGELPLAAGDKVMLRESGRIAQIISSARAEDGGLEFLAVTTLPTGSDTADETPEPQSGPVIRETPLSMPYALPQ